MVADRHQDVAESDTERLSALKKNLTLKSYVCHIKMEKSMYALVVLAIRMHS